jgi:RHS repeat-associated protein
MIEKTDCKLVRDIITDSKGSAVATADGNGLRARGYTPYGYAPLKDSEQSVLGYNGEYTDQVTGNYHLGNGYRAYSPVLMRFAAPDSLSPFSGGGLNTYAYCGGDPINAIDPTGHMKWYVWAGLIGGTLGVTAALGFNGWELVAAWRAIQKFEQIDELSSEFFTTSDQARSLVRLNKARLLLHGIVVGKDVASLGLQVGIDVAAFKQNTTVVAWAFTIQAFLAGVDIYTGYKAVKFRRQASLHESAFNDFRNRIENMRQTMPLVELSHGSVGGAVEPAGEGPIGASTPLSGRRALSAALEPPSEHIYRNWPRSRSASGHIYNAPASPDDYISADRPPEAWPRELRRMFYIRREGGVVDSIRSYGGLSHTASVTSRSTLSAPGAFDLTQGWGARMVIRM